MSRVTVSVVTPSFSASTAVPAIAPGLPGMVTSMSACSGLVQVSDCTMSTSAPTNFLAKPGTRSVGWEYSIRTFIGSPWAPSMVTACLVAWMVTQTSSRNARSASIAATSASGAS